jgi:hypothetical protein
MRIRQKGRSDTEPGRLELGPDREHRQTNTTTRLGLAVHSRRGGGHGNANDGWITGSRASGALGLRPRPR